MLNNIPRIPSLPWAAALDISSLLHVFDPCEAQSSAAEVRPRPPSTGSGRSLHPARPGLALLCETPLPSAPGPPHVLGFSPSRDITCWLYSGKSPLTCHGSRPLSEAPDLSGNTREGGLGSPCTGPSPHSRRAVHLTADATTLSAAPLHPLYSQASQCHLQTVAQSRLSLSPPRPTTVQTPLIPSNCQAP